MLDIKAEKEKYLAEAEDLKSKLLALNKLKVPFWKRRLLLNLRIERELIFLAIAERKGIIAFLNSKDGEQK